MMEILCRGKVARKGGDWVFGVPVPIEINTRKTGRVLLIESVNYDEIDNYAPLFIQDEVYAETIGRFSGLCDRNGKRVFEGDVVQYQNISEYDIQAVVCFGEYKQDGSRGEYRPSDCIGWHVKVDNYTRPDWAEEAGIHLSDCEFEDSLSEIVSKCIVIGNIHDNPELVKEETK